MIGKPISTTFAALITGAMLIACNGGAAGSGDGKGGKPFKVGIVFDSGGRGDKSFNDSAWAGVQRAQKELGLTADNTKTVDSKSEKDYEGNIQGLASAGCDLVFAVGFSQNNALKTVAPKYPNAKFAIIDAEVPLPNVRSLRFTEEQGSFLAGYLAGFVTKTGKIGFVGGMSSPLIEKFQAGYESGAKTSNPNVEISAKYTESWDDTSLGKAAALTLFNGGADIVYHAAGRCGLGVIGAAKQTGKWAIGVDSNQDDEAPGTVLTSMVKHVDEAVFQTIKDTKDGKFTAGTKWYDLASKGVGLTDFKNTKRTITLAVLIKVAAEQRKIELGQIKVPTTLTEARAYESTLKR